MSKPLSAALLLLGFLGCGGTWRSDLGKADSGRKSTPSDLPKEDLAAGSRQEYPLPILAYYRNHLPPGRNKAALLDLHIRLADGHFDSHIGGSRTRFGEPQEAAAEAILGAEIRFNAAPPEAKALQAGPIRIQGHARPYPYRDGEAYVVFSSPRLGGGVLDRAFGQQEIAFLETAFLPQIAALRGAAKGPSLPPGVVLDHLDRKPAVLKVRRFLSVVGRERLEGGTRLQDIRDFRAEEHLVLLPTPMDITLAAMAARPAHGQAGYTREDLEIMVVTAARAFQDTLAALHAEHKPLVIHTGPWGVAEAGHSPAVAWISATSAPSGTWSPGSWPRPNGIRPGGRAIRC